MVECLIVSQRLIYDKRHNELRDFTADLLAECHKDVKI